MYELAKSSREAMKSKARRLAGEKDSKVDSSNWSPAKPLNTEKKTGLQPTSRKCGGTTVGKVDGMATAFRADRKPRKSGGRVETKKAAGGSLPSPEEAMESEVRTKGIRVTDTKMPKPEEAAERSGKTPQDMPGRKCGGRTKKADGGSKMSAEDLRAAYAAGKKRAESMPEDKVREETRKAIDSSGNYDRLVEMGKKRGGRAARATGGRAKGKGKTNISINILAGGKAPAADMGAMPPAPPPSMPIPTPAPPPAAPPPAMMPMPMGGNQPPMARKRGGRVYSSYKDMDAGAASGDGRLEKTEIQKKKRRA